MTPPQRCRLLEPDGTPLTTGRCELIRGPGAWSAVISMFAQPGRVVRRCLLDGLSNIRIEFDGGTPVEARVEHVYFDPDLGRVCTVRLATFEPRGRLGVVDAPRARRYVARRELAREGARSTRVTTA
jgi:hypothetical protein